jgi:hypothetical protein
MDADPAQDPRWRARPLQGRRLFPVNKIFGPATAQIRIKGVEDEFLGVFLGSSSR